jgi:hypothetical protein
VTRVNSLRIIVGIQITKYNLSMALVSENTHGAHIGVTPAFLQEFEIVESNPNFDVFDSNDGSRRFIAVKASRIADDEDVSVGRFGIDFNRAKPEFDEAIVYRASLNQGSMWMSNIAFAAFNEEEYQKKAYVWESFYSYIFDAIPKTVWVAPHSGSVAKSPDNSLLDPHVMTDTGTAEVAALCAFNDKIVAAKRIMIAVHATGFLGAVLNLGDLGVADANKMEMVTKAVESKYHEKVQILADEFIEDFRSKTLVYIENIQDQHKTLDPEQLDGLSADDAFAIRLYERGLRFYGQQIRRHNVDEFRQALTNLVQVDVPVISTNYLYTGRNVGMLLGLQEKKAQGLLDSAIQIECARVYSARDPKLVSEIVLDIRKAFFN